MSEVTTPEKTAESLEEKLIRLGSAFPLTPERRVEVEAEAVLAKERERRFKAEALRISWSAPRRHATYDPAPAGQWGAALALAKVKLSGPKPGVTIAFIGARGNGKTQLAVELMRWRTDALHSALFTTAIEFFMSIKSTYKSDSKESEKDVLNQFGRPSLLVIDEVGKRGQTEWENNLLFQLLNERYNDMKDTVLIDNQTRDEFENSIGPSLASRMNEGGCIIECTWKSFRE